MRLLYQDAIEQFVHKEPQDAGQNIGDVIKKFHIHYHSLIASDERPTVAHKAHHKHNLISQLWNKHKQREGKANSYCPEWLYAVSYATRAGGGTSG